MKRTMIWSVAVIAAAAMSMPVLSADVKTQKKTTFSMEGVMGGLVRMFGGKAAREGITSTIAVQGNRRASITDKTGEIVDLDEQRVYMLDMDEKEYRVRTFDEIRAEFEKAKADAEERAKDADAEEREQMEEAGRQLEFTAEVKETGEHRTLLGHQTREVILTVTGREKGKTLEESGGFVMTSDMWLAPRIAELDELAAFETKYAQAIYGGLFSAGDAQAMAGMLAMYPSFAQMAETMQRERGKLDGTPLSTTVTFETVRSEEQMKQAAAEQEDSGGGGFGGMLARRLTRNRNQPQQRSTVLTTTDEMLTIDTTVAASDVAVPAGFKLKK